MAYETIKISEERSIASMAYPLVKKRLLWRLISRPSWTIVHAVFTPKQTENLNSWDTACNVQYRWTLFDEICSLTEPHWFTSDISQMCPIADRAWQSISCVMLSVTRDLLSSIIPVSMLCLLLTRKTVLKFFDMTQWIGDWKFCSREHTALNPQSKKPHLTSKSTHCFCQF